jgi:hypothetical protein
VARAPEVVDDHVLKIRPAGLEEVTHHGVAVRHPAGGRPKEINYHIFKTSQVSIGLGIKTLVCSFHILWRHAMAITYAAFYIT